MERKKGFTLIELLAVIVILAIIALITTPIILNVINDAKKNAVKDCAYGYIDAIETQNQMNALDSEKYPLIEGELLSVSDINDKVSVNGKKPLFGTITVTNTKVVSATLCITGYTVIYDGLNATTDGTKCQTEADLKKSNITTDNASVSFDNTNLVVSHTAIATYSNINMTNAYYFVKTSIVTKLSTNTTIKKCGNNISGTTTSCNSGDVIQNGTLEADVWYQVEVPTLNILFEDNGSIYVAAGDGTKLVETQTATTTSVLSESAGDVEYDDTNTKMGCNDVECAIEVLEELYE